MWKRFAIVAMFLMAAVFPILFVPLLALTLAILFGLIPYVSTHRVWDKTPQDIEAEKRLQHH
jgi:hypothetical protein